MKNKLWRDCSEEEKKAVKSIEDRFRYLQIRLVNGDVDLDKYRKEIAKLNRRLDEIERKYGKD